MSYTPAGRNSDCERPGQSGSAEELAEFYTSRQFDGCSRLERWEVGAAAGDSVTPAAYDAVYRSTIASFIVGLVGSNATPEMLSVGCGNGHVEANLIRRGYVLQALDVLPEAVAFANARGVPTFIGDVRSWVPDRAFDVIYADGLLGHLFNSSLESVDGLARMASWLTPRGFLVVSCDSPNSARVERVPDVPGYWWLSAAFLKEGMQRVGLRTVAEQIYTYRRPYSGYRLRTVLASTPI